MNITLIAAVSENNVIGKNNDLMWKIPEDMKFFKETTTAHTIIMGRKTFESISNGKPLPNRTSVVITRDSDYKKEGIIIKNSITSALDYCQNEDVVFVIGGGQIYENTIDIADTLYITKIHKNFDGDVYFPIIDETKWKKNSETKSEKQHSDFEYSFIKYTRIY